jgi:hypothetical protein
MKWKYSSPGFIDSRRPGHLGDRLAKYKIDEARQLTSEQRLLLAIELSDAAVALQCACLNNH